MMKIRTAAAVCLLLILLSGSSAAQSTATVRKIEAYLAQMEKVGYSGSVLVAFDGKPIISRGYGDSDREGKIKNSPKTIHDIGSITKQFTAAAILKLEMDGKLSTDDKIVKYFENVPPDKAIITIHDLLRHQSGLRGGIGGDYEKITEQEFIQKVLASELRSPGGTKFGYSNIGYSLLALIVEKVSSQTYEQYLYENLWRPAEMEMTGYSRPKFNKDLIAVGYKNDQRWGKATEKEWPGDAPYWHLKGNGGILSTTEDLLKWDRALMSEKILSKQAKQKYFYPTLRPDETGKSHYGYGWDVMKTIRNTTRIWHNGSNGVFYADFYRFTDEGVTIVLLTNNWQDGFLTAGRAISKIIFNPKYEPVIPTPETQANRAFTEEVIQIVLEKGFAAATERYLARDKNLNLIQVLVNRKGVAMLDERKFRESIDLFKLNVLAFPRSAGARDSLGEAYMESGDKKLAIEHYKKALELDPEIESAREALEKLEAN